MRNRIQMIKYKLIQIQIKKNYNSLIIYLIIIKVKMIKTF